MCSKYEVIVWPNKNLTLSVQYKHCKLRFREQVSHWFYLRTTFQDILAIQTSINITDECCLQSFHGTAALEQLVSSEEEDDLTLSADEGFSPPTPSPCELSPARASLRYAWADKLSYN